MKANYREFYRHMAQEEFKLPKMGESITEGTILNWLVAEGDTFQEGDVIVEVGTDKVDNEVPAPFTGRLVAIHAVKDSVVEVGETIASVEQIAEADVPKQEKTSHAKPQNDASPQPTSRPPEQSKQIKTQPQVSQTFKASSRGNQFYSPLVEQIAKDYHISYEELARIPASGQNGRLKKSDIFNYIENGRPFQFAQAVLEQSGFKVPDLSFDKGQGERVEMDRMRQMIADHMVFSKHTSPHVTAYVEADMSNMVKWRQDHKSKFQSKTGQKLSFTPLFIQAVTRAIQDFPMINSSLDGKEIIVKDDINIGMATALPSGNLIVPVIKAASTKSLETLAAEVNTLATKARDGQLTSEETKGSTFTISNVGTFGSLMGTPIINQPEAAILATGIIKKRAEVIENEDGDTIEIRPMMYLSLSFDHRIVDGFLAGSFLRRIADYFEETPSITY